MPDVGESLGDRIRQARERIRMSTGRRMTQGELAAAVAVRRNTVSRWENGEVQPNNPMQLLQTARVLRVPVEWLIEGSPAATPGVVPTQVGEEHAGDYPQPVSGELPSAAAGVVATYLGRLERAGCTPAQCAAAKALFVAATRNTVARTPLDSREERDIIADADAAWDLIVSVLRREGVRP